MKKVILLCCLISLFIVNAFALPNTSDTLNVSVAVTEGAGADKDEEDIVLSQGIILSFRYKILDNDNYIPANLDDFTVVENNASVSVTLRGEHSLYLAVGVNGNPVKDTAVSLAFDVDGWYLDSGDNKVDESSATISLRENGIVKLSPVDSMISTQIEEPNILKIMHSAGLQKEKVFAGYAVYEWNAVSPNAGLYTATITVGISAA